jgi:MFS superfamily sulfate permease-like transporter
MPDAAADRSPIAAPASALRADFLASIVVFLVALPLCMGIAIASGVPPALGLLTGIIGGIVVGVIQGAPLQVSGPAAGLVVMVVGIVQEYGPGGLGVVVAIAGALQLIAGLLRGGRLFRAVPPSVIYGMLAGIGLLIAASQFHVMIDDTPQGSGLHNLLTIPQAVLKAVVSESPLPHREAAAIGVLTIATILLWMRLVPNWIRAMLPAPLGGVLVAALTANLLALPIAYVSVPADLLSTLNWPSLPALGDLPGYAGSAVALALVASAETLLCAAAVDRMHSGPRTNYNRELAAQGVGNLLCGAVGALPMTAVIVRSGTNVLAGARTRLSTILHGGWLLLLVVCLPQLLTLIPVCALAGVLVYTGCKLANPAVLAQLRPYGRGEVIIFLITTGAVVAVDLLTGVLLGLVLAVAKLLLRLSTLRMSVEDHPDSTTTVLHLSGSATFLRLADVAETLERIPADRELHVHFDDLDYVDHAVLELFRDWAEQHRNQGGEIILDWDIFENRYHFGRDGKAGARTPVSGVAA